MINEEYKIWKKNTPFMYDFVITHALDCPSPTVQWLPDRVEPPGKGYSVQKLILGTHSYGSEPDYLMLAQVHLPLEDAENDGRYYDDERSDLVDLDATTGMYIAHLGCACSNFVGLIFFLLFFYYYLWEWGRGRRRERRTGARGRTPDSKTLSGVWLT